ncbi:uncharacterized protein EV422DRAFT_502621 [Fimicolochytrium jonesii]|uniref:uncharacterized protein n=1 Tax=Fimicolochytrium jonesii TaxID=1396493 RepID=UPI0022FEA255|nr:uncharacterized protein EV422DRAFT_502621 [Fimicolochytrium jonesii]KAI8826888.1 hypothetical protein EV422DRAFT_502621 [Fimicolochytrium jonesii]
MEKLLPLEHNNNPVGTVPSTPTAAADKTTISVRCPSYPNESFTVEEALDSTISQLKHALVAVVPGCPSVEEMRLIHAGKLLADESSVRMALKADTGAAGPHIVHLVLKTAPLQSSQPTNISSPTEGLRLRRPAHLDTSVDSSTQAANVPVPEDQPPIALATSPMGQPFNVPNHHAYPMYPGASPFQIVMINGLPYAMHTPMDHFPPHHLLPDPNNNLYGPTPTIASPLSVAPPSTATPPATPPEAAAPAPAVVPPPAPAPAPPAAALAPIDPEFRDFPQNEAPQNPYWLLFKLTFLVYVFSHNTSLTRIITLNLVALAVFMIQMERRARAVRAAANGGRINGVVAPPAAAAVVPNGENQPPAATTEGSVATEAAVPAESGFVASLQRAKLVATLFFTSLVPDHHD